MEQRLSLIGETISICRLERQEGRLREEAATTAASYETQLSVMSEHLARGSENKNGASCSLFRNSNLQHELSVS